MSRNIVETAVIQLYCSGSGTTIEEITWSKDGTTLTNDPPHLRIRGSSTDMSVLTIDNFNSSDDGQYVCHVTGSTGSATSPILTLTGMYIDGNVGYQWLKPVMHGQKFLPHSPAMSCMYDCTSERYRRKCKHCEGVFEVMVLIEYQFSIASLVHPIYSCLATLADKTHFVTLTWGSKDCPLQSC